MTQKFNLPHTFILIIFTLLFSCYSKPNKDISDFLELENLEKVEMRNNSGTFFLNNKQLIRFKMEIENIPFVPDKSVKVGGIGFTLTIAGVEYHAAGNTNGDYIEIAGGKLKEHGSSSLFFKTEGINFDNYQEEE